MGVPRTKQDNEEIQSYKVPEFVSPYPARQNVFAPRVGPRCRAWFEEQSLSTVFSNPSDWQFILECRVYDLATWVFVDAEEEELVWMCTFLLWLFVLDDMLEEPEYFFSLEKSASIFVELSMLVMWTFPDDASIREVFSNLLLTQQPDWQPRTMDYVNSKLAEARLRPGTVYDIVKIGPVGIALKDLWVRLITSTPTDSAIRWAVTLVRYICGNAEEAANRNKKTFPSSADYVAVRRNSSAMASCYVIVDFMDKVSEALPSELFDSPEMRECQDATNDIVSWHNDIWSFKKEYRKGELHNLVYIISQERGCSFSEAADLVLKMVSKRLEDLVQASADLEKKTPPEHQQGVAGYIKASKFWVSGTHQFHRTSKRFI